MTLLVEDLSVIDNLLETHLVRYLIEHGAFDYIANLGFDKHTYVYEVYLDLIGEIL